MLTDLLQISAFLGYSFMLWSPNQRANQIRRSYKNEEFDWLFDFVTVTWKNNPFLAVSVWALIRDEQMEYT